MMFDNIGGKIKTLAQVATWVGIIAFVIMGFVLMATDDDLVLTGFIVAILGALSSWVSSFVLYGFIFCKLKFHLLYERFIFAQKF